MGTGQVTNDVGAKVLTLVQRPAGAGGQVPAPPAPDNGDTESSGNSNSDMDVSDGQDEGVDNENRKD